MRITRETLLRLARETAQQRAYDQSDILAIYLVGSVTQSDPLLGGSADIDLVIVHENRPSLWREIVPLSSDIHLDIQHRARTDYQNPRELRLHPWRGYELYDPILLYERQPFFEFVQAALRGGTEFVSPGLSYRRANQMLREARRAWLQLTTEPTPQAAAHPELLRALEQAAQALMQLSGAPLTQRRFLQAFVQRLETSGLAELSQPFLDLLGAFRLSQADLEALLPSWQEAFWAAANSAANRDSDIHPARLNYYLKAMRHHLEQNGPIFALWPLVHTWNRAAAVLPADAQDPWKALCERLGWTQGATLAEQLDRYLDRVEEALETYAQAHGLEVEPPLMV